MRLDIPVGTDAIWRSGDFTGANRPARRVTIQRPLMRRDSFQMQTTFRRVPVVYNDVASFNPYPTGIDPTQGESVTNIYNDFLFTSPAPPVEIGGVRSIAWERTMNIDAAQCTVEFANTRPRPIGAPALNGDLDEPGYLTPGHGRTAFSKRWGHEPNQYADLMQPDNILRTYEGYGCDMSVPPEEDPHLVLTGVWLIDDIQPSARGGLTVVARDAGRLLIDHLNWLPVVPDDFYPTAFQDWNQRVSVASRYSNIERLPITAIGSGDDLWPESSYVGASVYGHTHTHTTDDDPATYWLSVGNPSPGYRSAYEYVDFALDSATVSEIRFTTVKAGYNAYVSIKQGGGWMAGPIMGYHRDGRGRYEEGVPYVASVGGLPNEGPHSIRLDNIPGVTLVRLWLGNLPNFGLPGSKYRAGIRDVSMYGPVQHTSTSQVALTPGPAGSNPGHVSDYTDIVKLFCAWAGLFWPSDGYVFHSNGAKVPLAPARADTAVLGAPVRGRVWGDFQATGTAPVAEITAATFDKKTLIEGVRYVADILGFSFWIDETGAAQWRMPNIWTMGNWASGMSATPGRTSAMLTIDERVALTDLGASITSRNIREGIFVANPVGRYGAIVGGYNPNPTGLMRMGGYTDQNFASVEESRVMADLIAVRQLFKYRTDRVRIPAHPALQIDDQVRIFERVTSEGFVHYVNGISSNNSADTGKWIYDLQTHWLGDDPSGAWILDKSTLTSITAEYVDALQGTGVESVRAGLVI